MKYFDKMFTSLSGHGEMGKDVECAKGGCKESTNDDDAQCPRLPTGISDSRLWVRTLRAKGTLTAIYTIDTFLASCQILFFFRKVLQQRWN